MKKISLAIGTNNEKNIRVRLCLELIDDETGHPMASPHYHSSGDMPPGYPISKERLRLEESISLPYSVTGIPGAPWPKIPDEEWAEVERIVSILHTPERIAKRKEIDLKNEMTLKVTRK